jgi:hypothetical protein
MLQAGFRPKPLGPDDERARKEAWRLYESWMSQKDNPTPIPLPGEKLTKEQICMARKYPSNSVGAAWQEWVRTPQWQKLALSNRTKIWWPAWEKRIEPVFGRVNPNTVTMAQISEWRQVIEQEFGGDAAHKALKIWRTLWKIMRSLRYTQLTDPSEKVTNTAPAPRQARHTQVGALHLAKTAWRLGYRGLACVIITCWDTGFQPVDARTARSKHLGVDPQTGRLIIDRSQDGREKTGVAVIGTLSRLGDAMVRSYTVGLGVELHQEAFLFRTRTGSPYREAVLSHDFQDLRAKVDPSSKLQLRDMRRSATTEAFRGGANSTAVSQKFGNSIDRSALLFRTYNPVDLEQVRHADEARVRGRRQNKK